MQISGATQGGGANQNHWVFTDVNGRIYDVPDITRLGSLDPSKYMEQISEWGGAPDNPQYVGVGSRSMIDYDQNALARAVDDYRSSGMPNYVQHPSDYISGGASGFGGLMNSLHDAGVSAGTTAAKALNENVGSIVPSLIKAAPTVLTMVTPGAQAFAPVVAGLTATAERAPVHEGQGWGDALATGALAAGGTYLAQAGMNGMMSGLGGDANIPTFEEMQVADAYMGSIDSTVPYTGPVSGADALPSGMNLSGMPTGYDYSLDALSPSYGQAGNTAGSNYQVPVVPVSYPQDNIPTFEQMQAADQHMATVDSTVPYTGPASAEESVLSNFIGKMGETGLKKYAQGLLSSGSSPKMPTFSVGTPQAGHVPSYSYDPYEFSASLMSAPKYGQAQAVKAAEMAPKEKVNPLELTGYLKNYLGNYLA